MLQKLCVVLLAATFLFIGLPATAETRSGSSMSWNHKAFMQERKAALEAAKHKMVEKRKVELERKRQERHKQQVRRLREMTPEQLAAWKKQQAEIARKKAEWERRQSAVQKKTQ